MNIRVVERTSAKVAVVESSGLVIGTPQDALDLIATLRHEHRCERVVLPKECVAEEFFDLKTGLAGKVLQKFVNYQIKLAIVGDFSAYQSRALQDFIYESNKGGAVFFLPTEQEAVKALGKI